MDGRKTGWDEGSVKSAGESGMEEERRKFGHTALNPTVLMTREHDTGRYDNCKQDYKR